MKPTRTITIVVGDCNDYTVHQGEDYCAGLGWDEMLGEVATLTHPSLKSSRYGLHPPEFYQERTERLRQMRKQMEQVKAQSEIEALFRYVNEWGRRTGPHDALLPADQQSPVVRAAMAALGALSSAERIPA